MAYAISLLDDDTGDTLDLHHTVTEQRIQVVTAWAPAGPEVRAQTLQPFSIVEAPAVQERTRNLEAEVLPLVLTGDTVADVQEAAHDLEMFLERANAGGRVYLCLLDVGSSGEKYRSRVVVGQLELTGESEFELNDRGGGGVRVEFDLHLTRVPWWEGDRRQLQLAIGSGTAADSVTVTSRDLVRISDAILGSTPAPLELRIERLGSDIDAPTLLFGLLQYPPATTPDYIGTLTSADTELSGTDPIDIAKTAPAAFQPGGAGWFRVLMAPEESWSPPEKNPVSIFDSSVTVETPGVGWLATTTPGDHMGDAIVISSTSESGSDPAPEEINSQHIAGGDTAFVTLFSLESDGTIRFRLSSTFDDPNQGFSAGPQFTENAEEVFILALRLADETVYTWDVSLLDNSDETSPYEWSSSVVDNAGDANTMAVRTAVLGSATLQSILVDSTHANIDADDLTAIDAENYRGIVRQVAGHSNGVIELLGEWREAFRLDGAESRFTDLGVVRVDGDTWFYLQALPLDDRQEGRLPPIDLIWLPTDGVRKLGSSMPMVATAVLVDDGIEEETRVELDDGTTYAPEISEGGWLFGAPGEQPTLLCLFEDEDGDEPGSFKLEAYYRPRRMTV